MAKTKHGSADPIARDRLEFRAEGWLLDGEVRFLSPHTLKARRSLVDKLLWFLDREGFQQCGTDELRAFFAHVRNGHTEPAARWGNPRNRRPTRPKTSAVYFTDLRTLFGFLVEEGEIESSPFESLRRPVARSEQPEPLSEQQCRALIEAASKSRNAKRDVAIVLFMLDTGARRSETAGLRMADVDLRERTARVLGKGNKRRTLPLGRATTKALYDCIRDLPRDSHAPVFLSRRGPGAGQALSGGGIYRMLRRLGMAADVLRAHPHLLRHSCAIEFLRNHGNSFALQRLLGHTDMTMTRRYVAIADADVIAEHRHASPADRLLRGRR